MKIPPNDWSFDCRSLGWVVLIRDVVRVRGFEPPVSGPPALRFSQTKLHPGIGRTTYGFPSALGQRS